MTKTILNALLNIFLCKRGEADFEKPKFAIDNDKLYIKTNSEYKIGGVTYIVNSFYKREGKRTLDDNIKHLISKEVEKVS